MKRFEIDKLTSLFKALSDGNRLTILSHICKCSARKSAVNVGEISSCCDVDLSVISRHLSKLRDAGVLRAQKEGKEVFYSLEGKELARQLRALADFIEQSDCC